MRQECRRKSLVLIAIANIVTYNRRFIAKGTRNCKPVSVQNQRETGPGDGFISTPYIQ